MAYEIHDQANIRGKNFIIVDGDYTKIESDAIMSTVYKEKKAENYVNRLIQKVSDCYYFSRLKFPINDEIKIIEGDKNVHDGNFNDAIFVVDKNYSIKHLVMRGLVQSPFKRYNSIIIPVFKSVENIFNKDGIKQEIDVVIQSILKYVDAYGDISTIKDFYIGINKNPSMFSIASKFNLIQDN
ncbi:hypothetical protein ACFL1H_06265 [Nanoarchaeota archaeon]